MNLAEMLCFADIHELDRIAKAYDCVCSSHSKNELIQSILSSVGRKEVFRRQIDALSVEDIRFLNSLLYDKRTAFSLEELMARGMQTKFTKEEKENWNPRELIAKFKQHGWLFNGYSAQTKYLFQMPQDLKRRFGDALAQLFFTKLQVTPAAPSAYRDEQQLLSEDILQFLRYLQDHDVQTAADGTLYKRHIQQLLERFAVLEEPAAKAGWRFGYGTRFKEYPDRLSFIYDYCYFNGLMTEEGNGPAVSEAGLDRLRNRRKEDPRDLYHFWLRLYKGPIPTLQSLAFWIEKLAKPWVTADSMKKVLGDLVKPYYYDTPESILDLRVFKMMMHLGLLRIGEHAEYGPVLQVTKLGSGIIQGVYVHEDDRIVLPFDNA